MPDINFESNHTETDMMNEEIAPFEEIKEDFNIKHVMKNRNFTFSLDSREMKVLK